MNTDSVRPPPQRAPRFGFYRHNLRPIVITLAVISAFWCLFSSIAFFRAIGEERSQGVQNLVPISIVLGVLYIVVCAIEIFGAHSAYTAKLALVRIYTFLSAFTFLVILASGILRIVIHFTKKSELLDQCSTITTRDGVAVYPFGFWGPIYNSDFDDDDADRWCLRSWNRGSWSEILSMLATSLLAAFWTLVVYSYYRQLLDPSSVANTTRTTAQPIHYNPPYNASVPHLGYNMPYAGSSQPPQQYGNAQWAPPAGPPPAFAPPPGAPPEYVGGDRGDYGIEKDKKPENPFDDFTDVSKSKP